ncbi:MAG: class E sortase [Thermoleophilia bacterium]|nr:class E sortase [Thermoleophilia bacterium]
MQESQHRRKTGRARTIVLAALVILIGAAVMLYPKMTDLRYAWAQWRFAAGAVTAQSAGQGGCADPAHQSGVALPADAVAVLKIPAIGLEAYVLEGTSLSVLAKGPGHFPETPLPGESGNAAIAGHRTMYGHPFHDIDQLQPGDEILTGTTDRKAVYRVVEVFAVYPAETDVIAQTGSDRLTLTTCHPKGSATQRLVVVAELTG